MVVPVLNKKATEFVPKLVDIIHIEEIVSNQGSKIEECRLNNEEVLKKLKENLKPRICGSCQTEQFDYEKYCHNCQKDPWYNSTEKMTFGAFEADYAEYQAFKEFMKMKLNSQV